MGEKMLINAGHILYVDIGPHLFSTEDGDFVIGQRLVRQHIDRYV